MVFNLWEVFDVMVWCFGSWLNLDSFALRDLADQFKSKRHSIWNWNWTMKAAAELSVFDEWTFRNWNFILCEPIQSHGVSVFVSPQWPGEGQCCFEKRGSNDLQILYAGRTLGCWSCSQACLAACFGGAAGTQALDRFQRRHVCQQRIFTDFSNPVPSLRIAWETWAWNFDGLDSGGRISPQRLVWGAWEIIIALWWIEIGSGDIVRIEMPGGPRNRKEWGKRLPSGTVCKPEKNHTEAAASQAAEATSLYSDGIAISARSAGGAKPNLTSTSRDSAATG